MTMSSVKSFAKVNDGTYYDLMEPETDDCGLVVE